MTRVDRKDRNSLATFFLDVRNRLSLTLGRTQFVLLTKYPRQRNIFEIRVAYWTIKTRNRLRRHHPCHFESSFLGEVAENNRCGFFYMQVQVFTLINHTSAIFNHRFGFNEVLTSAYVNASLPWDIIPARLSPGFGIGQVKYTSRMTPPVLPSFFRSSLERP